MSTTKIDTGKVNPPAGDTAIASAGGNLVIASGLQWAYRLPKGDSEKTFNELQRNKRDNRQHKRCKQNCQEPGNGRGHQCHKDRN